MNPRNTTTHTGNTFTQHASDSAWAGVTNTKPAMAYLFYGEVPADWVPPNGKDFITLDKGRLNIPQSIYQMLAFDNPELVIENQGRRITIPAMLSSKKVRAMHLYTDVVSKITVFNALSADNDTYAIPMCEFIDRALLLNLLREIRICNYAIIDWPDNQRAATPEQLERVVEKLSTNHSPAHAPAAAPAKQPRAARTPKKPKVVLDDATALAVANVPVVEEVPIDDEVALAKANAA